MVFSYRVGLRRVGQSSTCSNGGFGTGMSLLPMSITDEAQPK